ncbi:nucleoside monophosphate kinase [bacterium]|jgi:adenylate kinase|nr:nucleoside monophosphate kinase [bacterium]
MTLCCLLIGAPGSGKGTQSSIISKKKNLVKLSTGDLIRQEVNKGTADGERMSLLISDGNLVDDATMILLLKRFFEENHIETGIVSDGFPRNLNQAKDLSKFFSSSPESVELKVLYLKIPVQDLIGRILSRRICVRCNEIFSMKDSRESLLKVCSTCGGELILRNDDNEKVVRKRHKIFEETILPMLEFYGDKVTTIDATLTKDKVTELILKELEDQ